MLRELLKEPPHRADAGPETSPTDRGTQGLTVGNQPAATVRWRRMRSCLGQLVVHRDGTVAYCTEETAGRPCPGEDHPHRGGFFAHRLVARHSCPRCTQVPVPTPQG
jgi:hypothetical protein